jgi:NodT family efflux transporter outer membrane factor (OMF) lipoprotein
MFPFHRMNSMHGLIALTSALSILSGCTVGPDYARPNAQTPAAYKESEGWKVAQPGDEMNRGKWWEIFGDQRLNALQEQVVISNQNVLLAESNFRQARALVQSARSAYYPTASVGVGVTRSKASATLGQRPVAPGALTDYTLPIDVSWEPDIWGKVQRSVEANRASAQASAADLESIQLSARAELAQDYFLLAAVDAQKQLLDATVVAYDKSLQLTKNRYAAGVASKADIVLAEAQLKTTQAQAIDLGVQRAQLEHAIALLIGKPASDFSLPTIPLAAVAPPVPTGLPSELLERRPDIAAAERRVAAANAEIGVTIAAFYPTVTLGVTGGFETTNAAKWLTMPSKFWSIGANASETLFDGGLRRAQTDQARAAYDGTVASYRQTVLTGFKEVEDNLAALRILEQEAQVQAEAVAASEQSVTLTTNQYKAGTVSYLAVVVTQASALSNERTAVDILARRLTANILLIKALGGGWSASQLPTNEQLSSDSSPSARTPVAIAEKDSAGTAGSGSVK